MADGIVIWPYFIPRSQQLCSEESTVWNLIDDFTLRQFSSVKDSRCLSETWKILSICHNYNNFTSPCIAFNVWGKGNSKINGSRIPFEHETTSSTEEGREEGFAAWRGTAGPPRAPPAREAATSDPPSRCFKRCFSIFDLFSGSVLGCFGVRFGVFRVAYCLKIISIPFALIL